MEKRAMGSELTDGLPAKEAAKILGVTLRTLREMVRNGLLQPLHSERNVRDATLFSTSDIAVLADLRFKKLDLGTVANMAMRAFVASKATEKRLARLTRMLGMDLTALETDETSVVAAVVEAQDFDAESAARLSVEEVYRWASRIHAIDETYLRLVEHHTGLSEPWAPFFEAAHLIAAAAPRTAFLYNKDLEAAYAHLETARRHLRAVMYVYYREKNGVRAADRVFPEMRKQGIDSELTSILYPS